MTILLLTLTVIRAYSIRFDVLDFAMDKHCLMPLSGHKFLSLKKFIFHFKSPPPPPPQFKWIK